MLGVLDHRQAEYPVEHDVAYLYATKFAFAEFYHECDLTNTFNPGIGRTSKQQRPRAVAGTEHDVGIGLQ